MCTKNTALGGCLETNTALGFASCCICLSTRHPRAVFSVHTRGSALTNTYIYYIYIYIYIYIYNIIYDVTAHTNTHISFVRIVVDNCMIF